MKRFLAIVLSIVVVIGCIPVLTLGANKDITRDTVLVLDNSGSMSGEPVSVLKQAAIKFCESVLASAGKNRVAIVVYESSIYSYCDFTDDIDALKAQINSMYGTGGTDINEAVLKADSLLSSSEASIKNMVIMTDGLAQSGATSTEGPYTSSDSSSYYKYANALYDTTTNLFDEYKIYTLGFFHDISESNKEFASRVLKDIQNAGYYEVENVDDLDFVFGDVAEDVVNKVKEIEFTYQSGKDYTAKCYYSDDYFSGSSYTYKPSLATMSLSLAMSAFGSGEGGNDYSNKSKNAQKLLEDIGCDPDDITANENFKKKPTTDSIGLIAGHKKIKVDKKEYTLIALAVRGGGYEQEWASNFKIGLNGQHQGFDEAKEEAISFLKTFIADEGITGDVKLWITGYSRAAATSNLIGGAIDSGEKLSSNINYELDDVYTYCFETPAGALIDEVTENKKPKAEYKNIFNIINSSDPVPYVAPASLGFGRYGVDWYLPSKDSDPEGYKQKRSSMEKIYNSLDSTEKYTVDDFQMKKIVIKYILKGGKSPIQDDKKNNFSQSLFLKSYVNIIGTEFLKSSRERYVSTYEFQIREICKIMFGCTKKQSDILIDTVVDLAKKNWPSLLGACLDPLNGEKEDLKIISEWLIEGLNAAGIKDYNKATVEAAGVYLSDFAIALILNHPNYFATAVENVSRLGEAHHPELCYSWLASMDINYGSNGAPQFNNGGYRIIYINCDVDVAVYDKDNKKVAAIVNESPDDKIDNSYIFGIDEDGQKYIVLPNTDDYTIEVKARNDDKVNISIDEYCAGAGLYTRSLDYFDIEMKKGEKITGDIPAYTDEEIENDTFDGSDAVYKLYDNDKNEIKSDSEKRGDDVGTEAYQVVAKSADEKKGIVTGSGTHMYGSFAQVEAAPANGYEFEGWYVNNKKVSSEETYRVCVKNNIELVAEFAEKQCDHKKTYVKDKKPATCISEGYSGDVYCSECNQMIKQGNIIQANDNHDYGNWVVTKKATASSTGTKTRECHACGDVETKSIPKLSKSSSKTPKTGYEFNYALWGVVLMLSSASFVLVSIEKRKISKKKEDVNN